MSNSKLQAPVCRTCGKPLILLDEEEQRWYCYKDDEVFYAREQRWGRQSDAVLKPGIVRAPKKVCPNCRVALSPSWRFCYNCGQALTIEVPAVFSATIKILWKHPLIFMPIFAGYAVNVLVFQLIALPLINRFNTEMFSPLRTLSPWPFLAQAVSISVVTVAIVNPLVLGMYPILVSETELGARMSLFGAFRNSLKKYPSLLAAYSLVLVIVILGSAFIAPGLIVATWYFYTIPAIMLQDRGVRSGMSASKSFAQDRKSSTFLLLIICYAPTIAAYFVETNVSVYLWYGTVYFVSYLVISSLGALLGAVMSSYVYVTYAMPKDKVKQSPT